MKDLCRNKLLYLCFCSSSRSRVMGQEEDEEQTTYLLELLEKEIQEKGDQKIQQEVTHPMISPEEGTDEEEVELSDLEKELLREEEIRLLYEQDYLLEQVSEFKDFVLTFVKCCWLFTTF